MIRAAILCVVSATLSPAPMWAQQDYDLAGAKAPVPQMRAKQSGHYKRIHQLALRLALLDRGEEAEDYLHKFVATHPQDAESRFLQGILHARRGDVSRAVERLRQAVDLGLPPGRIIAGPRNLFNAIHDHQFYRDLMSDHTERAIHGPLVGNVTDRAACVWLRTATEVRVSIRVSTSRDFQGDVVEASSRSTAGRDFTTIVRTAGLQPNQKYFYAYSIGKGPWIESDGQRFHTFPETANPAQFVIAFGGGAGYVPPNERMWKTIERFNPLALLLLGDNVYIDDPESVEMQRYTYYRRQSRPEWRALTASTSVFAIWDDHDFSTNDSWGGPLIDKPFWKLEYAWPIFQQNWANPAYGGGTELPGCYYQFAIGDVDFFMLDCRYYRTSPQVDEPSMLGSRQMEWLKQQLRGSQGVFKVLCSSVPFDFRTKGDSQDTWNGYRDEREEIFEFIADNRVEGVVLMSADRHRSDAWKIERPAGYDLYEFNSSRLTNQHVHPTMEKQGAIFSYNQLQSFGLVRFDTASQPPAIAYDVVSIDGQKVHSLQVSRDDLEMRD